MIDYLTKVDWGHWSALIVVLTFFGFLIKKFIPTRSEYEDLKDLSDTNTRDIKSLFRERLSFRKEVLDRIDGIARDLSDLKNTLLERN